jgi:hypothetical protein
MVFGQFGSDGTSYRFDCDNARYEGEIFDGEYVSSLAPFSAQGNYSLMSYLHFYNLMVDIQVENK